MVDVDENTGVSPTLFLPAGNSGPFGPLSDSQAVGLTGREHVALVTGLHRCLPMAGAGTQELIEPG